MKKLSLAAYALGFAAISVSYTNFAIAEDGDEDAYDKAYYECSEKAEASEDNYEHIFSECMKETGFPEEEIMDESGHDHDESGSGE